MAPNGGPKLTSLADRYRRLRQELPLARRLVAPVALVLAGPSATATVWWVQLPAAGQCDCCWRCGLVCSSDLLPRLLAAIAPNSPAAVRLTVGLTLGIFTPLFRL
jgi:hypothetical protein